MTRALRSMTGVGLAQGQLSPRLAATVKLTTVNGRFLEVTLRTQPRLDTAELEARVRAVLAEQLERGRAQLSMQLQALPGVAQELAFNWDVAARLAAELSARPGGLELAPLALRDLLALPGFVEGGGELELDEEEQVVLLGLVAAARDGLVAAREQEATALRGQIDGELALLRDFTEWLAGVNATVKAALLARLQERLAELLGGVEAPEDRLLVEAALAADRADVSEEVERLRAHLGHARRLLDGGGPVGKRLDFLTQELLREVNTAGSKCREAGVGERVVEAKAAVEKLREQFANLE